MAILRLIKCDVCGKAAPEEQPNAGWPGWGSLQGVALDGSANPTLCPEHLHAAASFLDQLKNGGDPDGLD